MPTESVKILIEAEDKATAQLKKAVTEQEKVAAKAELARARSKKSLAAERVELEQGAEAAHSFRLQLEGLTKAEADLIAKEKELIAEQKKRNAEQKKVDDIGGTKATKSGAEFFGAIAGMAGGSEIASVAGQVGGLTEKVGQFSEVAQKGGMTATLFKAGLVAAAGAIGFQVGSAIGNVVFQTEKWNTELERAIAKTKELESAQLKLMGESFESFKINLEIDPAGADEQIKNKLELINTEISEITKFKKAADASREALDKAGTLTLKESVMALSYSSGPLTEYVMSFSGANKARLADKQREVEQDKVRLQQLADEKKELEAILGIEKERTAKRKELAEQQASDNYVDGLKDQLAGLNAELIGTKNEFEALKNTVGDPTEAQTLLTEIEKANQKLAEKKRIAAEAEATEKKKADEEAARIKRTNDLRDSEISRLKEQAIAMAKGKEAAHAFKLEQQGLSAEEAKRIASEQAEYDRLEKLKGEKAKPELKATESRLLTRGPEQDPTAKNTAQMVKLAEAQLKRLDKIAAKSEKSDAKPQTLVVVSRGAA